MTTIFMLAAIVGGVLLACQFVMTFVGWGGHDLHGGPEPAAAWGVDSGMDLGHVSSATDGDAVGGSSAHGVPSGADSPHGSDWLFGLLTLRSVTAGLTFFGLAGLAAESAGWSGAGQVVAALSAGGVSLWTVSWALRQIRRLNEDGTIRIQRAIGKTGTVYIPIPSGRAGRGKIQLEVQGRLMEYEAVTDEATALPTGTKVTVLEVIGARTLAVRAGESS